MTQASHSVHQIRRRRPARSSMTKVSAFVGPTCSKLTPIRHSPYGTLARSRARAVMDISVTDCSAPTYQDPSAVRWDVASVSCWTSTPIGVWIYRQLNLSLQQTTRPFTGTLSLSPTTTVVVEPSNSASSFPTSSTASVTGFVSISMTAAKIHDFRLRNPVVWAICTHVIRKASTT